MTCKFCDEAFEEHWKLEIHTRKHEEAEQFTCDFCAKIFVAKWRLKKHRENHYRKNVKLCKYFKKEQLCPYEEVGCKFSHKTTNNTDNKSRKCASENGEKVHLDVKNTENDEILDDDIPEPEETMSYDSLENSADLSEESIESIMEKAKSIGKEDAEDSNTECQGCGTQEDEFQCSECEKTFCSKCINMDHTGKRHMCLNCEIGSDPED